LFPASNCAPSALRYGGQDVWQARYWYNGGFDLNIEVTPSSDTEDCQLNRQIVLRGDKFIEVGSANLQYNTASNEPDGPIGAPGASPNASESVWREDPFIYVYDYPGMNKGNLLSFYSSMITFRMSVYDKTDDLRPPSWISYQFVYTYDAPKAAIMSVNELARHIEPCS
jgi:hypothetical protein